MMVTKMGEFLSGNTFSHITIIHDKLFPDLI